MNAEVLAKIIDTLCNVADKVEMTEEENKYYDMAVGLIAMMAKGLQ